MDRVARMANRDELEAIVEEWVGSFESVQEVEEALADRGGVQCGRVRSWKEMLEDGHTDARRLVTSVDDPLMGATQVMNSPFRTEGVGSEVRGPAPLVGQHTYEIMRELLGCTDGEILEMINANAVHADPAVMTGLVQRLMEA